MSINLFVDGSPECKNGYLALSLDNSSINKAIHALYHKTNIMRKIFHPLAESISKRHGYKLSSSQLREYDQGLNREQPNTKPRYNNMNPIIQQYDNSAKELTLDDITEIFLDSVSTCIKEDRSMIITSDEHAFDNNQLEERIVANYAHKTTFKHNNPLFLVDTVIIDYANFTNDEYKGAVKGCINAENFERSWIATPISKDINIKMQDISSYIRDKKLLIRPADINMRTKRYTFPNSIFVNEGIIEYIHVNILAAKEKHKRI